MKPWRLALLAVFIAVTAAAAPCTNCTNAQNLTCTECVSPSEITGPIPCSKLDPFACSGGGGTALSFAPCPSGQFQTGNFSDGSPMCALPPTSTTPVAGWTDQGSRLLASKPVAVPAIQARKAERLHARLRDGRLTLGLSCEPLERNADYRPGAILCGGNGDLYTPSGACTTGAARPASLPYDARPGLTVPAAAVIYPEWAAGGNPGWYYTAQTACTLAAKLAVGTWCRASSCFTTSGTCTLIGMPIFPMTVFDGSCQLQPAGIDIPRGAAAAEIGDRFPEGNATIGFGDNQGRPLTLGRGAYGGPDEVQFSAGGWGDMRTGDPGTIVRGSVAAPGFAVQATPWLGVATSPPPIVTSLAGTIPTANWYIIGVAWEAANGGITRVGPLVCARASSGGLRIGQPARDGWTWPVGGNGQTLGRVYLGGTDPAACTPSVLNAAQGTPNDPSKAFLLFVDYLYTPTDTLDLTSPNIEEFDSPVNVNVTGVAPFAVYDHTQGFGTCTVGSPVQVTHPCGTDPNNGWWYTPHGFACQAGCKKCDRRRGVSITPTALPAPWPSTRIPVRAADGICWQRLGARDVGVVYTASGYSDSCVWRTVVPVTDVPGGMTFSAGVCNHRNAAGVSGPYRLEFYGPGGVNDVRYSIGADGARSGP